MKMIVIGAPLTGKSTLAKYLAQNSNFTIKDFDNELLLRNNNVWPGKDAELNNRLRTEVEEAIIPMDNVVFFAFEFSIAGLLRAKSHGFKVCQLSASRRTLVQRNNSRLLTDPTNDAFHYIDQNLAYQKQISDAGLIDLQLDATLPIGVLADKLSAAKN